MGNGTGFVKERRALKVQWFEFSLSTLPHVSIWVRNCFVLFFFSVLFFTESVWAKGSSNSGGLSNIFTSSHLHICSSSHLLIFTSVHLHIFSSSHPHIFTSSHLHICSSSHLHIFSSSHLLIFSSSHLYILSCPLALLPSCSLLLFYFSLEGAGQCQRDGTKRNPFARNEVRSPKTGVNCDFSGPGATLSHEMKFDRQKLK